jgi:uncharacterized protein YndB with AHSA1/START domain
MIDSIERDIEVPNDLDALWDAVTDPACARTWLADEVEWELVSGGDARFVVDGEPRSGWIEDVREPASGEARLVFWWQHQDEPASRVQLTLTETGSGTRVRVCENRPLEVLDVSGIPLGGTAGQPYGPAMVCA